jgi:hypothetical protein
MPQPRLVLLAVVFAAAAAGAMPGRGGPPVEPAAAVAGAGVVAGTDPGPGDDPFPIARVRVPADRLADALKAFDPGPLTHLPRDEFEARVRAAGRAVAERRAVPRLLEARYTAALTGNDLTGEAEWVIVNPRPGPAWLSLDPLRVAVRSAAWADGTEAVIGPAGAGFPPGLGLWVPAGGRRTLKLGWSAAGAGGPGDPQFDLRLPPAPAAVLDLTLPADRTPSTGSAEVSLTGPDPAPDGRRTWHLRFGGRSRLEFAARGPTPGPGAAVASLVARYGLSPGQTTCAFEYDLRPTDGPVGGWTLTVPPGLRVVEVEVNDRAGWRLDPAGRGLRVDLRQPGAGGAVRIEAVAPPATGGGFAPLPMVRPVGAVVIGDERVEVRVHPGLTVGAVDPGDYRMSETATTADDGRVFTLVGSRPAADPQAGDGFRRPPAVRLGDDGTEFTTFEAVEWRVAGGRVVVAARLTVRPRRGPLFGLTVRTPPGFDADRVATAPDDRVAYSGPAADGPGVAVEFARPVAAGQSLNLLLTLRGPAVPAGAARFPFPAVGVVGAAERDGWIAICPGPGRTATAQPDPAAEAPATDPTAPPPPPDAAVTYPWRTRPPAGEIVLTPAIPPPPTEPTPTEPPPAPPAGWSFADLRLTTVGTDPATVLFEGAVAGPGGAFPLGLPAGAAVESVTVAGRAALPGGIGVPVPPGAEPVRFAVRYRLPPTNGGWFRRVASPVPELPGGPHPVRRVWAFPPAVLPAWPVGARGPGAALPAEVGGVAGLAVIAYPGADLVVVPARWAAAAGVALAALFAAAGWVAARCRSRWPGAVLLLALAGVGAAGLVGPAAWGRAARPAVAVGVLAAAAVVVARGWRRGRKPAPSAIGRVWDVAAAVVILVIPAVAQPETRDTVFVVSAEGGDGREFVLAPRPLLDRLDAAARPPVPGAVITSAEYDGRAEDGLARFAARFVVHTFADGETAVALPLTGVQLEAATADGRPATPASPRPDVYTVAVRGRGRHEVGARFAVPIAVTGPEREARFGVPEVPAAKVAFATPAGAGPVRAVGRYGAQAVSHILAGPRLAADLGAARAVHLRWRQGAAGPATVAVREGCVWDVSEAGDRLTACYLARVTAGAATGFRFDLPPELEPVRAAVQGLTPGAQAPVARWSVGAEADGVRPLQLDLAGPAEGRLLVTLECVRRGPPTRRPVLRFPRPVGVEREGGVYGLRANGVAIEGVERSGVIDFAADALVREFRDVPALGLAPATPVLAFSPQPGAAAELRPVLRPGPDPAEASEEVTWRVGPTRADGEGVIRWAARDPVPAVEFAVPGVRVAEVRGAEVAGWGEVNGRVQVRFRRPARGGVVRWAGTVEVPRPGAVELGSAAVANAKPGSTVVRVIPADGFDVRAGQNTGWRPATPAGRGLTFRADGPAPPVRVEVVPASSERPRPPAIPTAPEPRPAAPPPAVAPQPAPAPATPGDPATALPVRTAAGWGLAVLLVAVLFVLAPRPTWPEQVGLLGGLFGAAVAGGPAVGLAAWGLARAGWLVSRSWRPAAGGATG